MSEKKYVPSGVFLLCDKNLLPGTLTVTSNTTSDATGNKFATEADSQANSNIKLTGVCLVTRTPCMPKPIKWDGLKNDVLVHRNRLLVEDSKIKCMTGGNISIFFSMSAALLAATGGADQKIFDGVDDYLKTLGPPFADEARSYLGSEEAKWQFARDTVVGLGELAIEATKDRIHTAQALFHTVTHPVESYESTKAEIAKGWRTATSEDTWISLREDAIALGTKARDTAEWLSDPANRKKLADEARAKTQKWYSQQSPRDKSRIATRTVLEVGSLFLAIGEVNAAVKASRLAKAAKLAKAAELARVAPEVAETAKLLQGGQSVGGVITGAEEVAEGTKVAEGAGKTCRPCQAMEGAADVTKGTSKIHPVDVATGMVYTQGIDFALPGPIPLVWSRIWYSRSPRQGPLGAGWHHSYDLTLLEEADGTVGVRLADGRLALFPPVADKSQVRFNRLEKLELRLTAQGYRVWNILARQWYVFAPLAGQPTQALVAVEDANGFAIRFTYAVDGTLTAIIDSAGRRLAVESDEAGRLTAIYGPHPTQAESQLVLVRYEYDEHGNLISTTNPEGYAMHFRYRDHLLVQETSRHGLNFYFFYEGHGLEARCTHGWADGGLYTAYLRYDAPDQTSVIDALGNTEVYYHLNGLVTTYIDQVGAVSEWYYNEYNELELSRDPLGSNTLYDYDSRGNLIEVSYPDGGIAQTEYNELDLPVRSINPAGAEWIWAYDNAGNMVERCDATGVTTRIRYENGLAVELGDGQNVRTHLRYNAAHQLVHLVTEGDQISSRRYDALGRLVELTDAQGNRQQRHYDALGQLIRVREADGLERTFVYDGEGNVLLATEGSKQVRFTYEGLSRLASREQAGARLAFQYDREGNLLGLTNEHGEQYSFLLDAAGRVVTETGFDGLTRNYVRDAAGRVTEVQRPAGRRTTYSYDVAGRVTEAVHNEQERLQYQYRNDGMLVEARTENTTVRFERNAAGQVLREVQNGYEVTSTYDTLGQRVGLQSSLGATVHFERNAQGQVVRTQAATWQSVVERDNRGLEVQRTLSGGVRTGWQYDAHGLPTGQVVTGAGSGERRRRYRWQGTDQLTEIEDSLTGRVTFAYDAWDNLAGARYANGEQQLRTPDAVGNLYGTLGRTDRTYGRGGQLKQAGGVRYYYDAEGNLVRKVLADGKQWHYRWDGAGQLVEVKRPDGYAVTFAYDALGRRVSKRYRGRVTRWVWDGDVPLHEWSELEVGPGTSSVENLTTWLFEEESFVPAAKLTPRGAYSVVCDHLGTPLTMYDERGQVAWEMELDSYGGVRRGRGQAQDCPFRYQGQYEDTETGLYYNRFRYYDPQTGQYISQDPLVLAGGFALYAYVSNPSFWIDPIGLNGGSGVTNGISNNPGIVRRFMSKQEYKAFKKDGFVYNPADSRGGISTTSTKINPVNPDAIRRSTGALGAEYYVDIDTKGKNVELKGMTKGGVPDWKIKDNVTIDDIVNSGRVCK